MTGIYELGRVYVDFLWGSRYIFKDEKKRAINLLNMGVYRDSSK
jgi:hypothetical protein